MGLLSDADIAAAVTSGAIHITPFRASQLQPASYDVRLGNRFRYRVMPKETRKRREIDPLAQDDHTRAKEATQYVMQSGQLVLGTTLERIKLPPNIGARIEGKSSLARLGLVIHATGGFIDPGFEGDITLEMSCVYPELRFRLYAGMAIAQIAFQTLSSPSQRPYKGKYQDQAGPVASQYWRNYPDGRIT